MDHTLMLNCIKCMCQSCAVVFLNLSSMFVLDSSHKYTQVKYALKQTLVILSSLQEYQ
jgi:hypothetical protein